MIDSKKHFQKIKTFMSFTILYFTYYELSIIINSARQKKESPTVPDLS